MAQSVVFGATFQLSNSQHYGSINSNVMGNSFSMGLLSGKASVTVSLMFLINGKKVHSSIIVNNTNQEQPIPSNATYLEFNIQEATVTGESASLRMDVWKNS